MEGSDSVPTPGDFVEVRTRRWLVEDVTGGGAQVRARLACIDDDAQGETLEVLWRDEVDASVVADSHLSVFENPGTDDPEVFSAYLRSIRWNTATAADRKLLQAPFRAGIHLDAYQLVPLAKALALPRVNLLIADDVGAGKTIEAGLILRELILRRRVDFVVVCAPPSMTRQWQDELQAKFGLAFTIIDREYLASVRRERGFAVNPWSSGSLFLLSHSLVTDEVYTAGLRDVLGEFRARSLFILDEAHHAAPASGSRYAVDSQFTRAIEALAPRFEHRLFLTATPHNGHSNSFTKLLEILDPQRFTAGVDVRPDDLAPIMVRRLKSDLKRFGENFPTRRVEAIVIDGLPADAPELVLANKLAAYDALVAERTRNLPPAAVARSRLVMVGLQQRLLSSIAAFTRTLEKHRNRLEQHLSDAPSVEAIASLLEPIELEDEPEDEAGAEAQIQKEEDEAAEAIDAGIGDKALVEEMLEIARRHANRPDARIAKLNAWIRENMTTGGQWTDRRLLLFTEYEDTRRWLERRLLEALHDLDPEDRIACFTGATSTDRREELKRRFNADPATDPLRILICTDAAREGINLQARCHDLIHIDLPWNPARLLMRPKISVHHVFGYIPGTVLLSAPHVVTVREDYLFFATVQSRIHELWVNMFGASLEDRICYTPSDCLETFPLPGDPASGPTVESVGQAYYEHRAALMVARNEGMTKTYNRFHDPDERSEDIERLRELHAEMDRAVLRAYGWDDLAGRAEPIFLDETNEDDHTYQGRLFWPSQFRDEVLARLLALNAERHAEELRLGLAPGTNGKAPEEGEGDEEEQTV